LNALLISGSDTDVGKTVLTTALVAYWQAYSAQKLAILKPIQTGTGDRELYTRLFELDQTPEQINPLRFQAPLAPPLAAAQEGHTIDLGVVWQTFQALQRSRDFVLVEGLGGLGSPITHELTVADLARDWRLPTVLVIPVKLGAIAQAVANVALARQAKVQIRGLVLNCAQPCTLEDIENWAPAELIRSLTQVPVLGTMPYLQDPRDRAQLAQIASGLDLEQLSPYFCPGKFKASSGASA